MRNTKKYINKLWDAGYTLRDGGVYWLNGDASLKASERQKFRKILGWMENLPKMLKEKFNLDYNIVIGSNFYENGGEEIFEIYGFDRDTEQDIFYFGGVVNDVDENGYIHHWEGFKRLLKLIDTNNLDYHLDVYFRPIEIVRDKDTITISHTESIFGVQNLINFLYNENNDVNKKGWLFKDHLSFTNMPDKFLGVYHAGGTGDKDYFFWEPEHTTRLLVLEVWYSSEDNSKVVNYNWNTDFEIMTNEEDNNSSWIHRWDKDRSEYVPFIKNKFN